MKNFWQKFGKSLLMPISTLAAAGLFLGIAAALQNTQIVGENFVKITAVQNVITAIRQLAGLVFGNLPIFFAISIAAGMADDEKPTAIYATVLGFLAFHLMLSFMLKLNGTTSATTSVDFLMKEKGMSLIEANLENARYETVLGYFTYRMNIFGAIVVALYVSILHNKFYRIKLPSAINFFGGKRFIPIITLITIPFVAIGAYYIWPLFDTIIGKLGLLIDNTGIFGTFIFGALNRLLIPTGLHHILNQLVRFTPIGGSALIGGEQINGALNIFSTALATPGTPIEVFRLGTKFIGQGHMVIAMFGLPGAALAMWKCAPDNRKGQVKALLTAGVFASFLTGVTEPIEFAFMFVSPILFVFHAIMTGLSYMIMALLQASVGNIQAGFIDFIIFGLLRGLETKWYFVLILGAGMFILYYSFFNFAIKKFNILTPGRDNDENIQVNNHEQPVLKMDDEHRIITIIDGLGGAKNINEIDNCFTRLRVKLYDGSLLNKDIIELTNPSGIIDQGHGHYHIIYGVQVESIAQDLKDYLKRGEK